ncbi:MAG: signal peptidase II [Treponema sp.]|jgi:signal peptidase II|nr:signal peptidase II [Treponema sp.]
MKIDKERAVPLLLTGAIILVDQCTKAFIAAKWPLNVLIADVFNNEFLQIWHVRNKVIAFSLGKSIPDAIKPIMFIVLPLLVLGVLVWYYLSSNDFTRLQRWAVAGILGGGIGNIIDRIFRPDGVVDFISVKFYGLFGFERWPTFNLADSSVVVCCILLLISIIIGSRNKKEAAK